jgi:hypothetical protein
MERRNVNSAAEPQPNETLMKSLLPSLYKREEFPSLAKRGEGRFYGACQFNFEALNKCLTKIREIDR